MISLSLSPTLPFSSWNYLVPALFHVSQQIKYMGLTVCELYIQLTFKSGAMLQEYWIISLLCVPQRAFYSAELREKLYIVRNCHMKFLYSWSNFYSFSDGPSTQHRRKEEALGLWRFLAYGKTQSQGLTGFWVWHSIQRAIEMENMQIH